MMPAPAIARCSYSTSSVIWNAALCVLRPGNVHSADGWDGVLKPVVVRYQGKVSRIYFRAARSSGHGCRAEFAGNAMRLQLHALAYNLSDCHAFEQSTGGMCPEASGNRQISCSTIVRTARAAGSHPHLASVLQQGWKSPNIRVSLEVIRGIPVSKS